MTDTRRTFTLPADWDAAFTEAAAARGLSISEWLRLAGRAKLDKQTRRLLSEPRKRGRPKK